MTAKLTRENFRGPWAGLPVAWSSDDRFDEAAYRRDVEACCKAGMPGVYTGGTSGEFYAQDFDEFKAVTAATVDACKRHQMPTMIGCTSTFTRGVTRRAAYAAECGAQAIQVAMPFWMEIADSQVVPFFREAAAAAPGLALSVYETRRSKKVLTLDQHKRIKDAVPSYLMVKSNEATLGNSAEGCRQLTEFVNVFTGEDRWAELGQAGVLGSCSSLVYWSPPFILGYWREVMAKNWPAVAAAGADLQALFDFFGAKFGDRDFTDSAIDRLGGTATGFLSAGLRTRAPYPSATPEDAAVIREWMKQNCPNMLKL